MRPAPVIRTAAATLALAALVVVLVACAKTTDAGSGTTTAPTGTPRTTPAPGSTAGPVGPTVTSPGSDTSVRVPVRPNGTASTLVPQEDLLLNAIRGSWNGEAGSLVFGTDGTATLDLRLCPPVAGGPRFGYTTDCPSEQFTGRVSVGTYNLTLLAPDNITSRSFGAFIDQQGRWHLGRGGIYAMTPELQGVIRDPARPYAIGVNGDQCLRHDFATGQEQPEPCHWDLVDGIKVLTVDGSTYLYDPAAGVIVTPDLYFTTLSKAS